MAQPFRVLDGLRIHPRAAAAGIPITSMGDLTQLPAAVNLTIYRGDDFTFTLTVTNPDGSPYDLSTSTILAQIRSKPDAADPPAAVLTTSVATNVITLTLTHTISAGLAAGSYCWDCQLTDALGNVHTIAGGGLTLTADVSR
jgi:hypothetical protein